jgi:hypothetical protein
MTSLCMPVTAQHITTMPLTQMKIAEQHDTRLCKKGIISHIAYLSIIYLYYLFIIFYLIH